MADDLERLDALIRETLPELEAHGLNYGPFHYRYDSGREPARPRDELRLGRRGGGAGRAVDFVEPSWIGVAIRPHGRTV